MRITGWVAGSLLLAGLAIVPSSVKIGVGQMPSQNTQNSGQNSHTPTIDKDGGPDPMKDRMEEQASRNRNTERHRRIMSDTDKLLALSVELKADVDRTTKNEMSMDVIKKAAEIEKLAHDVKERMKGQ